MIPQLPDELVDCDMLEEDLAQLWLELVVELCDEKYAGRLHNNRRTYDAGCHGPLCRKATRERGRRRTDTKPSEKYILVDAILEAWHPIALQRIQQMRIRMIDQLVG